MLVLLCYLLFCLFVFGGCGWFARAVGSYIVGVLGYLCGLIFADCDCWVLLWFTL